MECVPLISALSSVVTEIPCFYMNTYFNKNLNHELTYFGRLLSRARKRLLQSCLFCMQLPSSPTVMAPASISNVFTKVMGGRPLFGLPCVGSQSISWLAGNSG